MSPTVVGSAIDEVRALCEGLGGDLLALPDEPASVGVGVGALGWLWADDLQRWQDETRNARTADRVVVAAWPQFTAARGALVDASIESWVQRGELPLARWFAAMGVAASVCADGGAIVAVIERAAPLDCAGWAPETGVADAVESMVRSLARAEGTRNVRVNAVTTPVRLPAPTIVAPAPSLATFPGSLDVEVVGAVRMLLGPDAVGVTGTVVHADCGRSWR
jgi:enoyl-[acyl-carrier-protein] reductase (NADH)